MTVMDGLKGAAATLRAADKIPEYNAILDAQQKIFDLQGENQQLKNKLAKLDKLKNVDFEKGHSWMIDPKDPDRKLCPICTQKNDIRHPLNSMNYCNVCKRGYE